MTGKKIFPNLSTNEKAVLVALYGAQKDGKSPSTAEIAASIGVSVKECLSCMKRLEEIGYVAEHARTN